MAYPLTRVSNEAAGIGPKIPAASIVSLIKRKATHVSFHSNRIQSLEIPMLNQRSRSKYASIYSEENCLDAVIELDMSNNILNEGCELSQFSQPTRFSLLSMTPRLLKLNLSSNNLTEKSLRALVCVKKPDGGTIPLLPSLRQLDISNNNITSFPEDLAALFPSLTHMTAMNNKIKSLTALLQTLYSVRGRLESIHLLNKKSKCLERNNLVCHKRFYREKIIFILGDSLKQLDGSKISLNEHDTVRRKLARDYQIEVNDHCRQKQELTHDHCYEQSRTFDQLYADERIYVESRDQCQENSVSGSLPSSPDNCGKDLQLSNLELQMASLSALIQEQTHLTTNLIQASQKNVLDAEEAAAVPTQPVTDRVKDRSNESPTSKPADMDNSADRLRKLALARAYLGMTLLERGYRISRLQFAFSRWRLFAGVIDYSSQMESKLAAAKLQWQTRTDQLICAAVQKETEKSKSRLSVSIKAEQTAHNKSLQLKSTIQDLENRLKEATQKCQESNERATELELNVRQLQASFVDKDVEHASLVRRLRADLDCVKVELANERACVESARQLKDKEAQSCMAEIHELKIQILHKDAAIRQLKDAFEKVVTKSASDRSKEEQASLAERQAKELLLKSNNEISRLEDEIVRLTSTKARLESTLVNHERRSLDMQQEIDTKSSDNAVAKLEIDRLKSANKKKDIEIQELESSIDKVTADSNEIRKAKSRLEQRVEQLQTQLDCIHNEMRLVKDSTVKREWLDAEKAKHADLEHTHQKLRREYKAQESELRDSIKRLTRQYDTARDNACSQAKVIKSLEKKLKRSQLDWRQKESGLIDRHRLEMKKLRITLEREVVQRQEAETRISLLEAAENELKTKMQSAIAGLSNKLSTLT